MALRRQQVSFWLVSPAEDINNFLYLIVFVLLRLDAGAFFMSVLIIRVEVKNTHA